MVYWFGVAGFGGLVHAVGVHVGLSLVGLGRWVCDASGFVGGFGVLWLLRLVCLCSVCVLCFV